MNQIAALLLLAAGLVLLAGGIHAFNSTDPTLAGLLGTSSARHWIWLVTGGIVAAAGVGACLRGEKA
jgi:hypothetical protein